MTGPRQGGHAEVQVRVIYIDHEGIDQQTVIRSSQVLKCPVKALRVIRSGIDAYFGVLDGYTVLSVQLEVLAEQSFTPEKGQVLGFPGVSGYGNTLPAPLV